MAFYGNRKIGLIEYFQYIFQIQNPKYFFNYKKLHVKESKRTFYIDMCIKLLLFYIAFRILEDNNYFNYGSKILEYTLLVTAVVIVYFVSEFCHAFYARFDFFEKPNKSSDLEG